MLKQFESSSIVLLDERDMKDFIKLENKGIKIVQIQKLYDSESGPMFLVEFFETIEDTGLVN